MEGEAAGLYLRVESERIPLVPCRHALFGAKRANKPPVLVGELLPPDESCDEMFLHTTNNVVVPAHPIIDFSSISAPFHDQATLRPDC